jgi:hypothetical protein
MERQEESTVKLYHSLILMYLRLNRFGCLHILQRDLAAYHSQLYPEHFLSNRETSKERSMHGHSPAINQLTHKAQIRHPRTGPRFSEGTPRSEIFNFPQSRLVSAHDSRIWNCGFEPALLASGIAHCVPRVEPDNGLLPY